MSKQEKEDIVVVRDVLGAGRQLLVEPRIHSAFLGFSLDKTISDKHIELLLEWAHKHSYLCSVVIDDMEFRHNFMVFRGINELEATELALSRGLQLAARIAGAAGKVSYLLRPGDEVSNRLSVCQSSTFWPAVGSFLEPLTWAYQENAEFKLTVDGQVERSLGRKLAGWRIQVQEERFLAGKIQLANFVLEETAITLTCVEGGYSTEIYAGLPIQPVVDLYDPENIKFPELRKVLNLRGQYGHISLGIERAPQKQTSLR